MRAFTAAAVVWALATMPLRGQQEAQVPEIVRSGLEALTTSGYAEALDIWTANWGNEADGPQRADLAAAFERLFAAYGPPHATETVAIVDVGARVRRFYCVLMHDALPVYLLLVAYRAPDGWRVTSIFFNTVMDEVFSDGLFPRALPLRAR
jgi:hypothetical protein